MVTAMHDDSYVSVTPDLQFTHVVHPVMAPFRTVGVRGLSYNRFMSSWYESCKNVCCSNKKNYHQISSHICTCHDSSAVVTCAKLWPDWIFKKNSHKNSQHFNFELINILWNEFQAIWSLHMIISDTLWLHVLQLGIVEIKLKFNCEFYS